MRKNDLPNNGMHLTKNSGQFIVRFSEFWTEFWGQYTYLADILPTR